MSCDDLKDFNGLTTVTFDDDSRFWASADQFRVPNLNILFEVGSTYTSRLDRTVRHLESTHSSAFVYTNTAKLANEVTAALEAKLDLSEVYLDSDVITIFGNLKKRKNSSSSIPFAST